MLREMRRSLRNVGTTLPWTRIPKFIKRMKWIEILSLSVSCLWMQWEQLLPAPDTVTFPATMVCIPMKYKPKTTLPKAAFDNSLAQQWNKYLRHLPHDFIPAYLHPPGKILPNFSVYSSPSFIFLPCSIFSCVFSVPDMQYAYLLSASLTYNP